MRLTKYIRELDDYSLIEFVETLRARHQHVKQENQIFQTFLLREEPEVSTFLEEQTKIAVATAAEIQSGSSKHTRSDATSSGTTSVCSERVNTKVNLTQKTDLILREMDLIQNQYNKITHNYRIQKALLVAHLEEMTIRAVDIEESIVKLEDLMEMYPQVPIEKYQKFMMDWVKHAGLLCDKLRLRTSSLKVQFQKICGIYNQKLLDGSNLHEVDFDQLRINTMHLKENLVQKTLMESQLKKMHGSANLQLSQHKIKLIKRIEIKAERERSLEKITDYLHKVDIEMEKTIAEKEEAKQQHHYFVDLLTSYENPHILSYVRIKTQRNSLVKDMRRWQRRVEVQKAGLKLARADLKRAKKDSTLATDG